MPTLELLTQRVIQKRVFTVEFRQIRFITKPLLEAIEGFPCHIAVQHLLDQLMVGFFHPELREVA